ncbi:MAG: hypothetical protein IPP69_08575 [Flavobacteriales bacterium]|nr:hypothetical protein [Flavobacteriales bacterium]
MEDSKKKEEVKETPVKPEPEKKTLEEINKKEELPPMPNADEDLKSGSGTNTPRKRINSAPSSRLVQRRMYGDSSKNGSRK